MKSEFNGVILIDKIGELDFSKLKPLDQILLFEGCTHVEEEDKFLEHINHMVLIEKLYGGLFIFKAICSKPYPYFEDKKMVDIEFDDCGSSKQLFKSYLILPNKTIIKIAGEDGAENTFENEIEENLDEISQHLVDCVKNKIVYNECSMQSLAYQSEIALFYLAIPIDSKNSLILSIHHLIDSKNYSWSTKSSVLLVNDKQISVLNIELDTVLYYLEKCPDICQTQEFKQFNQIYEHSEFSMDVYIDKKETYKNLIVLKEIFKRINFKSVEGIDSFLKPFYVNENLNFKAYFGDIQSWSKGVHFVHNEKILPKRKEPESDRVFINERRKAWALYKFLVHDQSMNPLDGYFYKNNSKKELNETYEQRVIYRDELGIIYKSDQWQKDLFYYLKIDGFYIAMDADDPKELQQKLELRKAWGMYKFYQDKASLNPQDGLCYHHCGDKLVLAKDNIIYRDDQGLIINELVYLKLGGYYLLPEKDNREECDLIQELLGRKKLMDRLVESGPLLPKDAVV